MQTHNDVQQHLEECEKKVKHLEEENAHLREAADTFRGLAERLNTPQQDRPETGTERARRRRPTTNQHQSSAGRYEEIGDF